MSPKRIFTIGFELPGNEFEFVAFESAQSLLDADIIIYRPSGWQWSRAYEFGDYRKYQGQPIMNDESSSSVPKQLKHWRTEMRAAAEAGKLVIFWLDEPEDLFRYTGDKQFSGTGRNRQTTNIVTEISSYEAAPTNIKPTARKGTSIRLTSNTSIIGPYWKEFKDVSPYRATIEGEIGTVILQTPSVARTVGSIVTTTGGGAILYLPPISFDEEKFTRHDKKNPDKAFWNAEGMKFGKRLLAAAVAIAKGVSSGANVTPPPPWTLEPTFATNEEANIQKRLDSVKSKVAALEKEGAKLEQDLVAAGKLRFLLYEQGKALEAAILEALKLLGFDAEGYTGGGSEFDAVFVSEEGRCLGEAEGKDTKPINIDKLSQLERNIQEDFARDEVKEHAKGVLFGNAYRLSALAERGDYFTEKCLAGARRAKIALVRTPDLFPIARYLRESTDKEFARACRQAILEAEGEVVTFPAVPSTEVLTTVPSGSDVGDVR